MNPYIMALPTVAVGLVALYFALRAIRFANRLEAESVADFDRKMAALRPASAAAPELVVDLDVTDDATDRLEGASVRAKPVVLSLSEQERALGGAGLRVVAAKVAPGAVRLTLSPVERAGAAERVRRVAEEWNARGGPLPPGVTAARAAVSAA